MKLILRKFNYITAFCLTASLFIEADSSLFKKKLTLPKIAQRFNELPSSLKKQYTTLEKKLSNVATQHRRASAVATITTNNDLSQAEQDFLTARTAKTQAALEHFIKAPLHSSSIPRIGFCFSGGGCRATIATYGWLIAAQKTGLLDATHYIAALSGSSWAVAPWTMLNQSPTDMKNNLVGKLSLDNIMPTPLTIALIIGMLSKKRLSNQSISLVDHYGAFLAQLFLSNFNAHRQRVHFSESKRSFFEGTKPLPLCTAIEVGPPYHWFEFSPFFIGSTDISAFVPTWAFGRKFNNRISQDSAPEQSLGYLMGIWGSAFAFSLQDILMQTIGFIPPELIGTLQQIPLTKDIETWRISSGSVNNFAFNIPNNHIAHKKHMKFVDAGLDFNLPFPPLLRPQRKVDIIIACDASRGIEQSNSLKRLMRYAREKNIQLPPISLNGVSSRPISIFKSHKPGVPSIIYIPLIKNAKYSKTFDPQKASYTQTFNFLYSKKQIDELSGLAEFSLTEQAHHITNLIQEHVQNKHGIMHS